MTVRPFQLRTITIGDEPAAWSAAGFSIDDTRATIANTVIELAGASGQRGILSASLDGLNATIDGIPFVDPTIQEPRVVAHPNGVTELDHLVAMSPDMDRTTAALGAAGLEHRRTRRFEAGGTTRRQEFFWLGDVILELMGEDDTHGEGPATLWGLAFTCCDLDEAADHLGASLGAVKPALQRGRRIATVRTRELDISVPIALMSPHRREGES
jgi:hypothetical protein